MVIWQDLVRSRFFAASVEQITMTALTHLPTCYLLTNVWERGRALVCCAVKQIVRVARGRRVLVRKCLATVLGEALCYI